MPAKPNDADCSCGRPAPGVAATSTAFGPSSCPENTRYASTAAIATMPTFSSESGAAPASRRPSVTADPTISTIVATWPLRSSG